MTTYYNEKTGEYYYEGRSITRRLDDGHIFAGVPTAEQLAEWGFEPYVMPAHIPTEDEIREQRMQEIQIILDSMDYLTSKYIDGEDMTKYGDWQGKRKALREEYRELEAQRDIINEEGI